jgi:hypothetical protein
MILCITIEHFNRVKFTVELWKKHAYVTTVLNVMLQHWFFCGEVFLQTKNTTYNTNPPE